jgi:broad specificity phosphatase PhoE
VIEEGFSEDDELWHPTIRETKPELASRAQRVLDKIFDTDKEDTCTCRASSWIERILKTCMATVISITAHSGWINGFLTAIGREHFRLPTGGMAKPIYKIEGPNANISPQESYQS